MIDPTEQPWPERIALIERLCEHQSSGGTVLDFLRENEDAPSRSTLYRWVQQLEAVDHAVVGRIARAKKEGVESIFEEMKQISDAAPLMITTTNGDGEESSTRIDPADVQNRKLRIYVREQMAAKLDPGRYGHKVGVEHSADQSMVEVLRAARLRASATPQTNVDSVDDGAAE